MDGKDCKDQGFRGSADLEGFLKSWPGWRCVSRFSDIFVSVSLFGKGKPSGIPELLRAQHRLKLFADARALVLPTFAGEIGHIRLRGKQSVAQALSVLPGPVPAGEGGPHAREGT